MKISRHLFSFFNTKIRVVIHELEQNPQTEPILQEVENIFRLVANKFTRFSETSELGILNNYFDGRAEQKPLHISDELFFLVEFGIGYYQKSGGILDISIADILEQYGYKKDLDLKDPANKIVKAEIKALLENRPNCSNIILDKTQKTIWMKPNQKLDFGAYGKGYAIKKAKDYLIDQGYENFLINAGGDCYGHGKDQTTKDFWQFRILNHQKSLAQNKPVYKEVVKLQNQAIACSSPWARKLKEFNHLINPATGLPTKNLNEVYFVHQNPMVADAEATILALKA